MKKDFALIKRIIEKIYPVFDVHSATKLGEGWMSEVFELIMNGLFVLQRIEKVLGI